jgi:hypothetical protein
MQRGNTTMNYDILTEEEFQRLETVLKSITTFLPENEMSYIWQTVTKIYGHRGSQPCSCRSSAKLWTTAISDLRKFVDEKRNQ